jgi:hypothetical protein
VRVQVFARGLNNPRGLAFGPDGARSVSNFGFGVPTPGAGQMLRISLAGSPDKKGEGPGSSCSCSGVRLTLHRFLTNAAAAGGFERAWRGISRKNGE